MMPKPPPAHAARQLAQEVLQMLELRESTAVPRWAAARLAALWRAAGTRVLRVFPIAAARRREPSDDGYAIAIDSAALDEPPAPIGADRELLAAIDGRKPMSIEAGGGRRRGLIPLTANDQGRHLIESSPAAAHRPAGGLAASPMPL